MILAGAALEVAHEVPLYGGRSDFLPPAQTTPVDAVEVLLIDHLLEAFTGSLERLNSRYPLAETTSAIQAPALAYLKHQHATAESPIVMPDGAPTPAFVPQMRTSAGRTRYRADVAGRYGNLAAASLDVANLVLGQA